MLRMSPRLLPALALALAAGAITAAPAEAAVDRHIWGVVVDGKGRPVIGALAVAKGDGDRATMESYDDPDPSTGPRPGFFALYGLGNGTYDVTVTKAGFAPVTVQDVEISRKEKVVALGDIVLDRTTSVAAKVTNDVRVGQQGVVRVTVAPTGAKPSGKVVVTSTNGRKTFGSTNVRPRQNGVATVTLDKLPRGTYELRASFRGDSGFADSASPKFVLEVKPKKGNRPNARAWVA